ncbi:APC family permease [Halobellus captivus]|uniref:APC family permease n=1 Tax=Halobellus captivus TaxID=2592614 RepID=UPI00119CB3FB|nr:APC family permease [Halobellus captivus]
MVEKNKSSIGLIAAYAVAVGLSVGGGMWATPTVVSSMVGPLVLVLPLLAVISMLILAPTYFTLVKIWPTAAAHYKYPAMLLLPEKKKFGQLIGWTHIWSFIAVVAIVGLHLMVAAGGEFIANSTPVSYEITVISLLIIGFVIVWFGIRAVGITEILLASSILIAVFALLIPGIPKIQMENILISSPNNLNLGVSAFALIYGIVLPALLMIDLGDDIDNPGDAIPRSILVGIFGNMGIAFLMGLLSVGVLPYTELSGNTIAIVATQYLPSELLIIVAIGALVAGFSSLVGLITLLSRYLNAAANDGILPTWSGKLNKYGEPKYLLLLQFIIAIPSVFVGLPLRTIIGAATLSYLVGASLIMMIGIRMPRLYPEEFNKERLKSWIHNPKIVQFSALLGLIINLAAFIYLSYSDTIAFLIWLGMVVIGAIIFFIRILQSQNIVLPRGPDDLSIKFE